MANDGAPVCQLPNKGQIPPSQPGKRFPSVPKAQDLPSALAAVNALTQIVNILSAPALPPGNNLSLKIPNIPGLPLLLRGANQNPVDIRFVEAGRKTELVKIVNPDDDTQFIIVKRIKFIRFIDLVTGSTLLWDRGK